MKIQFDITDVDFEEFVIEIFDDFHEGKESISDFCKRLVLSKACEYHIQKVQQTETDAFSKILADKRQKFIREMETKIKAASDGE